MNLNKLAIERDPKSTLAPVLFATSSSIKFAQAKLLLGMHGIDVHLLSAHAHGYRETYGKSTQEFLSDSMKSAVSQAGIDRLLFIEDTTVRIEALSSPSIDFPGQQTKEWFRFARHSEVYDEVRQRDKDCRVSVSSDIALPLPVLS